MKVTIGIIGKCGVRGDATLCIVIFTVCSDCGWLIGLGYTGIHLTRSMSSAMLKSN